MQTASVAEQPGDIGGIPQSAIRVSPGDDHPERSGNLVGLILFALGALARLLFEDHESWREGLEGAEASGTPAFGAEPGHPASRPGPECESIEPEARPNDVATPP